MLLMVAQLLVKPWVIKTAKLPSFDADAAEPSVYMI